MLIIDQNAEQQVTAMLEAWRTNLEGHGRMLVIQRSALAALMRMQPTELCNYYIEVMGQSEANAYIYVMMAICLSLPIV